MPTKTVPLSVRVPLEDAEFIAGLQINGATTPSDKLRAIIDQARQRQIGGEDFDSFLSYFSEQMAPVTRKIRLGEHGGQKHSELLSIVCEKLPDLFAYMANFSAQRETLDPESLKELEGQAADRLFRLLEAVLRLAVTSRAPCYDPSAISDRIAPLLDLVKVVSLVSEKHREDDRQKETEV